MWRFTKANAEIFCFPGLWDVVETTEGRIESFTIVTTAPGPDCEPYHNRQPVVLEPDHWATWLNSQCRPCAVPTGRPGGRDRGRAGRGTRWGRVGDAGLIGGSDLVHRRRDLLNPMVDRLTVLRSERSSAASALRRVQVEIAGRSDQGGAHLARVEALNRTIDRLDHAIAQWDTFKVQFA